MSDKPRITEWVTRLICFGVLFVALPWFMIWSIKTAVWIVWGVGEWIPGLIVEPPNRVVTAIALVVVFGFMTAMTEAIKRLVRRLFTLVRRMTASAEET